MKNPTDVYAAAKLVDDLYRTAKDAFDAKRADNMTGLTWSIPQDLRERAMEMVRDLVLKDAEVRMAKTRAQLQSIGVTVTDADVEAVVAEHAAWLQKLQDEAAQKTTAKAMAP